MYLYLRISKIMYCNLLICLLYPLFLQTKIDGQQDFLKMIVYVDEFFYGNSFRALSMILHLAFLSNIISFDLFCR
jgi:hypothetical protein